MTSTISHVEFQLKYLHLFYGYLSYHNPKALLFILFSRNFMEKCFIAVILLIIIAILPISK